MENNKEKKINDIPSTHDTPKCLKCGNIGNPKTEAIITPAYFFIGCVYTFCWLEANLYDVVKSFFSLIINAPIPFRWLFAGLLSNIILSSQNINEIIQEINNVFASYMNRTTRIYIALAMGFIYFLVLFIIRGKKKNRSRICKICKAKNQFTDIY